MRKTLTPDQIAKRDARRARFQALCKKVAALSDVERAQMTVQMGTVPTCEGRLLSLNNTLLLMFQLPGVSMVGGFKQWLKAGRCVAKGQHGAMIWIRTGGKTDESTGEEKGDTSDGHFFTATVFDISQTVALVESNETARIDVLQGEVAA